MLGHLDWFLIGGSVGLLLGVVVTLLVGAKVFSLALNQLDSEMRAGNNSVIDGVIAGIRKRVIKPESDLAERQQS